MTGQKNPLASRTFLLVLFFILEIFIVLFFYRDYKGHDALYRAQMLQTLETGYRGATTGYDKTTQMIFEEVVNKPEVLKLIASALDDEKKRDTYRNALYRLMLPAYEMQKTIGIWQFHFHLKDGTSFLRMHSSGKYGDNLFRRPAVKLVNTEQKRVTGYEVGHFADGYRFMHPLFYKGRHIGSVEFAITSMGIIDYMNHVSPGQYYFIINRGIVDEMTYEDWKKINFKVSELSEGFVTGQWKTDDAVISAVNQKLKNRVKGRLARMERFVEAETVKGKDYLIAFLPIQDVSGKPAALFVQYLTDEYSGYHTRMKMIDISLFTILLAGLLYSIDNIQSRRIALQKNIELLSEKEQIILETMELNRSILHTSSIGILTYNASGQCVFANEAAAKIAGTSVAGMLSLNFHQLQSWKESGMYETALKALNTETEQETEAHVITTFGRDIWLNAKFSSFQSSGEKYLLMFTYDITESKHAEEKLRKSERRLRDSQKVAKIGSWRWDIVNNTLDWSDEAFRRFDKDPETFTPTVEYFVGLIHHEDREAVQRAIQASLENDAPYHIQPRIKNESGREWALEGFGKVERDAAGKPLRFSGTVQDVTERKNIEDVIRQSEIKYRSLVESLQEGIWAIDKDDITTFVNSRMAEMLGYIVDEMTGRSVFSFMDEHGIELCKENIERRKKGIKEQHDFELIKKDGARIFVTMEASPNFDENGEYTGGVAGVIDITERKKADEQIANSLREKETLLREIHHRVKNNMQVISSLMTLQSAYIKDKEAAAIFRESQERIKSMAIVHERLYLSENLAEIDLGEYIDALTKDIMRAFGAEPSRIGLEINTGAEVKLNIDTGIPCGLILNELITNSIKHAFPGGRTGKIIIDVNSDAEGYVTLKIIDNGTGLPEGFDHQNAKTLGLRLVHMLVRQLKGSIEKADTAGTVFIIKFKNVLA